MSLYRWHDPTVPGRIARTYQWSRLTNPDRVQIFAAKRRNKDEVKIEIPWREWVEVAKLEVFDLGATVRYRGPNCRVCFGWERLVRRDYAEVMHIRGVYDGREIKFHIPIHHWGDIIACMEVRPHMRGADRMAVLFDD